MGANKRAKVVTNNKMVDKAPKVLSMRFLIVIVNTSLLCGPNLERTIPFQLMHKA